MPSEQTVEYPQNIPLAPSRFHRKKEGLFALLKCLVFFLRKLYSISVNVSCFISLRSCRISMQKPFSSPRSGIKIPRVGEKTVKKEKCNCFIFNFSIFLIILRQMRQPRYTISITSLAVPIISEVP